MYLHEETRAGVTIIVRNHYSGRYKRKGLKRAPNENVTSDAQMLANMRKDTWELTIRMNASFTPRDHHFIFTYDDDHLPSDVDQAKRDRSNLIDRIRRLYRKNGKEPKYIICTGFGDKGRLHHHMVLSGEVSKKDVKALWKGGNATAKRLWDSREYSKLAAYFAKHRRGWQKRRAEGRMYVCSRNIERPPTVKYIVRRSDKYTYPHPRKGYYVDQDTVREGMTDEGWPFLSYILVKEERSP